jgi:CDP-diacylglycerol--glycerol-3-phosphate 3-phosphatidyltransferase
MLVHLKWAPAWVVVLIVGRELAVTGLRAVAVEQGIVMAADKFGKAKTILQIAALCPLIFHYDIGQFDPKPAGMALLYAALVLTVVSGANYMRGFFAGLRRKGEEI